MEASINRENLIKILRRKVVSTTKERDLELFRMGVQNTLKSHLNWMESWVSRNEKLFKKLGKLTASTEDEYKDDFALFQLELEEWVSEDLAAGMRYNALAKRHSSLQTAERKKVLEEEIEKHNKKIEKLAKKANKIGKDWIKKLEKAPFNGKVSTALQHLVNLKADSLKNDYKRWEKEKLIR